MARTNEELVAAAQSGDAPAMEELLGRHYDRIFAICRRISGNDADAYDAAQEALLAIVRGLERFDGRSKFSTWSYRIATNACLDELRRRNRRPDPTDDEHLQLASGSDAPQPGDGVDDQMLIEQALQQIPEQFRAPVVLRDMVGMDYADIAATLDIAPGTVRSRIARGRTALAEVLEPELFSSDDDRQAGNQTDVDERQRSDDD